MASRLSVESFKLKYRFFKDFFENKSLGEVYQLHELIDLFPHMWSPEMEFALSRLMRDGVIITDSLMTQFRVNPVRP